MASFIIGIASTVVAGVTVFLLQMFIRENRELKQTKEEAEQQRRKERKEERERLKDGVRALLRKELIAEHAKWTKKGYITPVALDCGRQMYSAYIGLDGNGVVPQMNDEIAELPIREENENEL